MQAKVQEHIQAIVLKAILKSQEPKGFLKMLVLLHGNVKLLCGPHAQVKGFVPGLAHKLWTVFTAYNAWHGLIAAIKESK